MRHDSREAGYRVSHATRRRAPEVGGFDSFQNNVQNYLRVKRSLCLSPPQGRMPLVTLVREKEGKRAEDSTGTGGRRQGKRLQLG
jgi:hypothetical protein